MTGIKTLVGHAQCTVYQMGTAEPRLVQATPEPWDTIIIYTPPTAVGNDLPV